MLLLLGPQITSQEVKGGTLWSQDGRIGLARLLSAHHSCLWGLQTNNSNSDANGLRQTVGGVYFYTLASVSSSTGYCPNVGQLPAIGVASGFSRLLSWILEEASFVEKQFSISSDREGEETELSWVQVSRPNSLGPDGPQIENCCS